MATETTDKLFDIFENNKVKVLSHGKKKAGECLKSYTSYINSVYRKKLSLVKRELLAQGLFIGSYDPGPEEHHLKVFNLNYNVDFNALHLSLKKVEESAVILILAESYRMACKSFENDPARSNRSKANITSFLLCTLYGVKKEYIAFDRGLCGYYARFLKNYWIPAFEKLYD
ncbi:MAG: hypothetical protein WDK96_01060 [Candidatus Paceibacterota bacterium]|jgi:hypothetical protein